MPHGKISIDIPNTEGLAHKAFAPTVLKHPACITLGEALGPVSLFPLLWAHRQCIHLHPPNLTHTKKTCQSQGGNQRLSREVVSSLSSNRLTFFIISVNDSAHFASAPLLRPPSIPGASGRHNCASEYCQWSIYFVAKDELSLSDCANLCPRRIFSSLVGGPALLTSWLFYLSPHFCLLYFISYLHLFISIFSFIRQHWLHSLMSSICKHGTSWNVAASDTLFI